MEAITWRFPTHPTTLARPLNGSTDICKSSFSVNPLCECPLLAAACVLHATMRVASPTAGGWSSSRWRPDEEFETDGSVVLPWRGIMVGDRSAAGRSGGGAATPPQSGPAARCSTMVASPKGTWTLVDSGKTGLFASRLACLGPLPVILRSFQSKKCPEVLARSCVRVHHGRTLDEDRKSEGRVR